MLPAVEAYFLTALQSALPAGTVLSAGPSAGPQDAAAALVEVIASRLSLPPLSGEGAEGSRGPAFFVQVHRFPADGATRDFVLPKDAKLPEDAKLPKDAKSDDPNVLEVESPPGRPAKRGDDYLVEGHTVRFYHPPAKADDAVTVRVRGGRSRGYEQVQPCRLELTLRVWAKERSKADELSNAALAGVLIAAADLGTFDGSDKARPAVSLRLLRAIAALTSIARSTEAVRDILFHRTDIEFSLRGDLEQIVALGEPELEGIIREVRRA